MSPCTCPQAPRASSPNEAGRLANTLKELAETIGPLPRVGRSPDPTFGFLPALSEVGRAGYLAIGDKCGVLALAHYQATRIVSARDFAVSIVESLQSADLFTAQRVLPPGRLVESSESA